MNHTDLCLQRLLRSARRASLPLPTEAPFYLEARVLNAWRYGLSDDPPPLLAPVLRRAMLAACAILVICTAFTLRSLRETPPDEVMVVGTAIQLALQ
jgi:hypothetical protein